MPVDLAGVQPADDRHQEGVGCIAETETAVMPNGTLTTSPSPRCMKSDLLGIWMIVQKLVLGRSLRLHRLKPSYGGLDLLRRQAVNVEV
jgi:hypothetical protein